MEQIFLRLCCYFIDVNPTIDHRILFKHVHITDKKRFYIDQKKKITYERDKEEMVIKSFLNNFKRWYTAHHVRGRFHEAILRPVIRYI